MRLATFDLASCTGVAYGAGDKRPRLLHWNFKKDGTDYGIMFLDAEQKIEAFLVAEKIDTVAFESPINGNPLHVSRILLGLICVLEKLCVKHKIARREVYNGAAKAKLSLHGHANKDDQLDAARLLGFDPEVHDEADAIGIWLCMLEKYDLPTYEKWKARQNTVAFQNLINRIVMRGKVKRSLAKPATNKGKKHAKPKPKRDTSPRLF